MIVTPSLDNYYERVVTGIVFQENAVYEKDIFLKKKNNLYELKRTEEGDGEQKAVLGKTKFFRTKICRVSAMTKLLLMDLNNYQMVWKILLLVLDKQ